MPSGRPAIQDEFTHLEVSRQRKCQLRWERDGLCNVCGEPAANGGTRCDKHVKEAQLRARAKTGCKPWRAGGPGRRPLSSKSL